MSRFVPTLPAPSPILIKELRGRMRGPRAFLLLTGFLLLLSLVTALFYFIMTSQLRFQGGITGSALVGVALFFCITLFEMMLVAFVTPALTAGTISGEREAMTYEMLVSTPLRPSSILMGKLVAAIFWVLLMLFAAIPMLSIVYIFGGVTVMDSINALLLLGAATVAFGTIGLFWSAALGRTSRATVMSYLTIMLMVIGPSVVSVIWVALRQQSAPLGFSLLNPFAAVTYLLDLGPDMIYSIPFLSTFLTMGGGGMALPPDPTTRPLWLWTLFLYVALALLFGTLASIYVRPRRRLPLGHLALLSFLLALLVGGASFVFTGRDWQRIITPPDLLFQMGAEG